MELEAPTPPGVDIKALAACFAPGAARAARLTFAADKLRGTPQEAEALRLAVETIKEATTDTAKFSEVSTRLFSLGLGDPGLDLSAQEWTNETDSKANAERAAIDKEAARAKAAVNRDGIREAAVALGDWHARRGEPQAALRAFLRARDYCSSPRDVAEVCLRAASAAAAAGSWAHVSSYASKAASSSSAVDDHAGVPFSSAVPSIPVISSAAVATALAGCAAAAFDAGRWREAALGFVKAADVADIDGGGVAGVGGGFAFDASTKTFSYPLDRDAANAPSLASPVDVALCGGLACLASLDRNELASIALASAGFRDALSLIPPLLEAVEAAAAARFGASLSKLRAGVLPRAHLDARASRAAPQLAAAATRRCLVQYAAPYSSLSLDAARDRLGFATRAELDEELARLVKKGAVRGKLDIPGGLLTSEAGAAAVVASSSASASASANGYECDTERGYGSGSGVTRQCPSLRAAAVDAALEAGLTYVADARALLLRAAMLSKGMVEQAPATANVGERGVGDAAAADAEEEDAEEEEAEGGGGGGGSGGGAAAPLTRRGLQQQRRQPARSRERLPEMDPSGTFSGGEGDMGGGPSSGRGSRRR